MVHGGPPMTATVMDVLAGTAQRYAERPALKAKRDGAWRTWTWAEYHADVRRVARGFMALGLQPGQGVVILGYNRPEWFLSDVGAIAAGGVPTGIYTTCTPDQIRYITHHAEAAVAVVENRASLAVIQSIRGQLPGLRAVVLMEGESPEPGVHSWAELLAAGAGVPEEGLEARLAAQR